MRAVNPNRQELADRAALLAAQRFYVGPSFCKYPARCRGSAAERYQQRACVPTATYRFYRWSCRKRRIRAYDYSVGALAGCGPAAVLDLAPLFPRFSIPASLPRESACHGTHGYRTIVVVGTERYQIVSGRTTMDHLIERHYAQPSRVDAVHVACRKAAERCLSLAATARWLK